MSGKRVYYDRKPAYWVGDYPSVTIHYREGDERTRDLLASEIERVIIAIERSKP